MTRLWTLLQFTIAIWSDLMYWCTDLLNTMVVLDATNRFAFYFVSLRYTYITLVHTFQEFQETIQPGFQAQNDICRTKMNHRISGYLYVEKNSSFSAANLIFRCYRTFYPHFRIVSLKMNMPNHQLTLTKDTKKDAEIMNRPLTRWRWINILCNCKETTNKCVNEQMLYRHYYWICATNI